MARDGADRGRARRRLPGCLPYARRSGGSAVRYVRRSGCPAGHTCVAAVLEAAQRWPSGAPLATSIDRGECWHEAALKKTARLGAAQRRRLQRVLGRGRNGRRAAVARLPVSLVARFPTQADSALERRRWALGCARTVIDRDSSPGSGDGVMERRFSRAVIPMAV
jgi:hypothetical protein